MPRRGCIITQGVIEMPANLTPEYMAADERYKNSKTSEEKLSALEDMLASIPKHKGTEKMQAEIKRRIKKLKEESARKKPGKSQFSYHVEREGAAQVIITGAPNAGKSSLLNLLTNAVSEVGDYPYTTHKTIPGMMRFENIQIQLVDTPAISDEFMETWIPGIIRNADGLIIAVDCSGDDPMEQLEIVISRLEASRLILEARPEEQNLPGGDMAKRTLIVATKMESERARENMAVLKDLYGGRFPLFGVSREAPQSLELLKREIFDWLEILRVYTKIPGSKADLGRPFIFRRGITVMEVAKAIHKDFAEKFKYARIWGSGRYEGQMVQKDYIVQDGDIIEVHAG